MKFEMRRSEKSGFLWLSNLYDLMGEYKKHRDRYPTFELFIPRIREFFNSYCNKLEKQVIQ